MCFWTTDRGVCGFRRLRDVYAGPDDQLGVVDAFLPPFSRSLVILLQ